MTASKLQRVIKKYSIESYWVLYKTPNEPEHLCAATSGELSSRIGTSLPIRKDGRLTVAWCTLFSAHLKKFTSLMNAKCGDIRTIGSTSALPSPDRAVCSIPIIL